MRKRQECASFTDRACVGLESGLTASFSLGTLDSAGVQAAVAVAQSSFEFWYADNYAELHAAEQAAADDLDDCFGGTMEDEQIEVDGVTYVCQGQQWRLASWQFKSRAGSIQLVAAGPRILTPVAMSCPTPGDATSFVTNADVGGAIVGAVAALPEAILAGPGAPGVLLGASYGASVVSSTVASVIHGIFAFFVC